MQLINEEIIFKGIRNVANRCIRISDILIHLFVYKSRLNIENMVAKFRSTKDQ
ncbi:MAG: hypothetical protein E7C38_02225 [Finegoldia magna]|nr:hypothetical protein [Finegoldia magna]